MSTQTNNIRTLENLYAAFQRGDLQFVIDHLADDVGEFRVVADADRKAPWHLGGRGRAGALAYFETLLGTLEFKSLEAFDLAATGDVVYATVRQEMTIRKSGKPLSLPASIHKFTFRDGKIVAWQAWEDTALTASAF